MDWLKRVIVILLGYIASCLIVPYAWGSIVWLIQQMIVPHRSYGSATFDGFVFFTTMATMVVAFYTSIPSAIAIIVSEFYRIRTFWPYPTFGITFVLLLVGGAALFSSGPVSTTAEEWIQLAGMLSAGAAAGAVYWLIAGRHAGVVQEMRNNRIQPATVAP